MFWGPLKTSALVASASLFLAAWPCPGPEAMHGVLWMLPGLFLTKEESDPWIDPWTLVSNPTELKESSPAWARDGRQLQAPCVPLLAHCTDRNWDSVQLASMLEMTDLESDTWGLEFRLGRFHGLCSRSRRLQETAHSLWPPHLYLPQWKGQIMYFFSLNITVSYNLWENMFY